MQKSKKKIITIIVAAVLCLGLIIPLIVMFTGCRQQQFLGAMPKYSMEIHYCEKERTLEVDMKVVYTNNTGTALTEVVFNMPPAAFREDAAIRPVVEGAELERAFPNGVSYGGIEIKRVLIENKEANFTIVGSDENALSVPLPRQLRNGQRVTISIEFVVTIPNKNHRFGFIGNQVNLGNFFPTLAVFENGEFVLTNYYSLGDPFFTEAAIFEVSINKPENLIAAMSGITTRLDVIDSRVTTASRIVGARDFAIVLGEFNILTAQLNETQIRYYHIGDSNAEFNLQTAVDSIATFSELFGDYPFETFSVVKTHFLHGGMEYPSLIMVADNLGQNDFTEVIVHEAAHQWWYAVVGNNQVRYAWLDESLAEFSTTLFFERNPRFNISYEQRMAAAITSLSLFANVLDNLEGFSTSVDRPLREFNSSLEYVVLAYTKGAVMLDALRTLIGDVAFFEALRNYYQNFKFRIASPQDLIAEFNNVTNKPLTPFFNTWLDGRVIIG